MGGNVVMMYAGSRPERVRRLVNLEGFGMPATTPDQAPGRYAKWMDELKKLHRGEMDLKAYDKADGVARRLMKTNPRLAATKLAKPKRTGWRATGRQKMRKANGRFWATQPTKSSTPTLWNVAEALELYKSITAPCWWWKPVMTHSAAGGTANSRWQNSMNG